MPNPPAPSGRKRKASTQPLSTDESPALVEAARSAAAMEYQSKQDKPFPAHRSARFARTRLVHSRALVSRPPPGDEKGGGKRLKSMDAQTRAFILSSAQLHGTVFPGLCDSDTETLQTLAANHSAHSSKTATASASAAAPPAPKHGPRAAPFAGRHPIPGATDIHLSTLNTFVSGAFVELGSFLPPTMHAQGHASAQTYTLGTDDGHLTLASTKQSRAPPIDDWLQWSQAWARARIAMAAHLEGLSANNTRANPSVFCPPADTLARMDKYSSALIAWTITHSVTHRPARSPPLALLLTRPLVSGARRDYVGQTPPHASLDVL